MEKQYQVARSYHYPNSYATTKALISEKLSGDVSIGFCPAGQNVIDDTLVGFSIGFIRLAEVGSARPTKVDKLQPIKTPCLCVTWNNMEVYVWVNHHQHQIIKLIVIKRFC